MELLKKLEDAIKAGDVTYLANGPCKHGHEPVRYTITGGCVACVKKRAAISLASRRAAVLKARDAAAVGGVHE